jgi:hypothetical protein
MPDAELVDTVSAALEQSERVDEHPILVTPTEDGVALKGADAADADPVRSTGGAMTEAGTERGPQAREDEAVREDFRTEGAILKSRREMMRERAHPGQA